MIATNGGRITMNPLLEHIQVESSCVCWGAVTPMLWFAWPDPWVRHTTLYQTSPRTAQHIRLTCELHIHCCKADCTHNTSFTERDSRLCMCDRSAEFQPYAIMWLNHDRTRVGTATCIITISIFSYCPHDPRSECLYCVNEEGYLLHTLSRWAVHLIEEWALFHLKGEWSYK